MDTGSRILQQRRDDVVVLRPLGPLDASLADDLRERTLEAHAPVVIDLDGCMRIDADAIHRIASAWHLYRPEFCFACGGVGDRRMITVASVSDAVAVFSSVDDAISKKTDAPGAWPIDAPDE
jgi:hypothetical protein